MKLEDIKIGMKVKLLGKHGLFDEYDSIEDWFEDNEGSDSVERIKEQGYGYVIDIDEYDEVWVDADISNDGWCFLSSDLEPCNLIDELDKTKLKYIFSPTMDVKMYDKNDKVIFEGEMDLSKDNKKSVVEIKNLVYDIENGTTIVYFTDDTKKIAIAEEDVEFDKEIGLLECLGKKLFGNRDGLLKVIESGKVIKRKKKVVKKKDIVNNVNIINEKSIFARFLDSEKIAIHCETEEEAQELFKILKKNGVRWTSKIELSKYSTKWGVYGKDTSYVKFVEGLQYCGRKWYEAHDFKIVKFKDLFN